MKKLSLLMLIAVAALTSCDKIKKDEDTPVSNTGAPIKELLPAEQKVKLEQIANNLMDEYPATEFEEFFQLAESFSETYLYNVSDQYWEPFFDFCEEREEEMFFYKEEESEKNGNIYYKWNVQAFLEFSQLQGLLTLGSTSLTCQDYDGTKMIFSLGKDNYVVELAASGKTTTAKYTYEDIYGYEDYQGYYDESTGYWVDKYVMVHYNDNYQFEVKVPEKIKLSITKNQNDFASVVITFDNRFTSSGVDVTMDCFQITATVTIDEHSVTLGRTGYDAATGKAQASYILKKGDKTITQAQFSSDVKMELVTENDEWSYGYDNYTYVEFTLAKECYIYVDVLGELQVQGTCSDIISLIDNIENLEDADNDSQAERAVDNINNFVNLGIYYDKSVTRQADVVMDYYVWTDDYYDESWYEPEPIIVFPDKSKYAFYEYFDEDSFVGLNNSFQLWLKMYETMFEHYFD